MPMVRNFGSLPSRVLLVAGAGDSIVARRQAQTVRARKMAPHKTMYTCVEITLRPLFSCAHWRRKNLAPVVIPSSSV